MDYTEQSREQARLQEIKRKEAWRLPECRSLYRNLINAAGGPEIVLSTPE